MTTSDTSNQPWIKTAGYDSIFILLPPFVAMLAVLLLPDRFRHSTDMPVFGWVFLVLFVDVAHVYSTLYNTYFDKARFARRKTLFITIPIVCFLVGFILHLFGDIIFWRALAYVAVFHFIRQQYGFMRIYTRQEPKHNLSTVMDTLIIYSATIYPLIYWHCTPGRNFNWFVSHDFITGSSESVKFYAGNIYVLILVGYVLTEFYQLLRTGHFNLPKNVLIAGTAVSWYLGIVWFNGDLAFTMLNVVSHGIPYMALVWFGISKTGNNGQAKSVRPVWRLSARWYGLFIFLGSLVLLAYLEEGLWDGFVWQEHQGVFSLFQWLPHIDNDILLAVLVPLLSLPQSTHYVLDGFIWRKRYD